MQCMKFDAYARELQLCQAFERVMEGGFEALGDEIESNAETKEKLQRIDYWKFIENIESECWPGLQLQKAQDVRTSWYAVQPWYVMLGLMRQCVDQCDGQKQITLTKKVEGFHVQIIRSGIWGKEAGKASKKNRCCEQLQKDVDVIAAHVVGDTFHDDDGRELPKILNIRAELVFDTKNGHCEDDSEVYFYPEYGLQEAYDRDVSNGYSKLRRIWRNEKTGRNSGQIIIYDAALSSDDVDDYTLDKRLEMVGYVLTLVQKDNFISNRVRIVDHATLSGDNCGVFETPHAKQFVAPEKVDVTLEGILKMAGKFLAHEEGLVLEVEDRDAKFRNKIKVKDWLFVNFDDVPKWVWYSNVNRDDSEGKKWDMAKKRRFLGPNGLLLFHDTNVCRHISPIDMQKYTKNFNSIVQKYYKEVEDPGESMESVFEDMTSRGSPEEEEETNAAAGAAGGAADKQPQPMQEQNDGEAGAESSAKGKRPLHPNHLSRVGRKVARSKQKTEKPDVDNASKQKTEKPDVDKLDADMRRFVFLV